MLKSSPQQVGDYGHRPGIASGYLLVVVRLLVFTVGVPQDKWSPWWISPLLWKLYLLGKYLNCSSPLGIQILRCSIPHSLPSPSNPLVKYLTLSHHLSPSTIIVSRTRSFSSQGPAVALVRRLQNYLRKRVQPLLSALAAKTDWCSSKGAGSRRPQSGGSGLWRCKRRVGQKSNQVCSWKVRQGNDDPNLHIRAQA